MANRTKRFGALLSRYKFMLNPYPNEKNSRCPLCEQRARQRKLPLVILIKPNATFVLNHTCRYCPTCDLLVAHKHEIEELLAIAYRYNDPRIIGNEYFIIGTVEKSAWREGMKHQRQASFMREHAGDFILHYEDLRLTQAGWFPANRKPPIMQPPPSKDWVKARRS